MKIISMERLKGNELPISQDVLHRYSGLFSFIEDLRKEGYQGCVGLIAVRPSTSNIESIPPIPGLRNKILFEELLLVRRREGIWTNPSGHVDNEDETILKALAREAFEETGLRFRQAPDYVVSDLLDVGFTNSGNYYALFKAWVRNNFTPQLADVDDDLDTVAWYDTRSSYSLLSEYQSKYQKYLLQYLLGWDTPIEARVETFLEKALSLINS